MIRFRKEILMVFLVCTLSAIAVNAQNDRIRKAVFAREIYFQFDRSTVNRNFSSNARTFEELDHFIEANGAGNIDSVVIIVQSSPEGVYEHNISLTRRRAAAISRYMDTHYPQIASKTSTYARGEAWDRFRENILKDKTLSKAQIDEILKVLDADINVGTRKWRMARLDTYPYLLENHYPRLRLSAIALVYAKEKITYVPAEGLTYLEEDTDVAKTVAETVARTEATSVTSDKSEVRTADEALQPAGRAKTGEIAAAAAAGLLPLPALAFDVEEGFDLNKNIYVDETQLIPDEFTTFEDLFMEEDSLEAPSIPPYRYPVVAFKTNFLMPGFNAGIEVPIGNHWSVAADWYWPWFWPKKQNEKCYELLGGAVEGRYWFGKERNKTHRLLGHSIGLYVHSGYYDLEKNYRGMQGEFVSTGLDYKYALGLGGKKHKKWGHFEFSIGLGYLYSTGRTYDVPKPGGALIPDDNVRNVHFFGPTRAEVSLVIPIYSRREGKK